MANELTIDTRAFDGLFQAVSESMPAVAYVVTTGARQQKYWGVLEGGSTPGRRPWPRPGPRTMYGKGGRIFSTQAPSGWIRIYADIFTGYLTDEYLAVAARTASLSQAQMQTVVNRAAQRCLQYVQKTVPVDTGALQKSLVTREGT